MSEAKLRQALEKIKTLGYIKDSTNFAAAVIIATEALAQPAEAVKLTDEEIISMAKISFLCDFSPLPVARHQIIRLARAVIAAHEAKRSQS